MRGHNRTKHRTRQEQDQAARGPTDDAPQHHRDPTAADVAPVSIADDAATAPVPALPPLAAASESSMDIATSAAANERRAMDDTADFGSSSTVRAVGSPVEVSEPPGTEEAVNDAEPSPFRVAGASLSHPPTIGYSSLDRREKDARATNDDLRLSARETSPAAAYDAASGAGWRRKSEEGRAGSPNPTGPRHAAPRAVSYKSTTASPLPAATSRERSVAAAGEDVAVARPAATDAADGRGGSRSRGPSSGAVSKPLETESSLVLSPTGVLRRQGSHVIHRASSRLVLPKSVNTMTLLKDYGVDGLAPVAPAGFDQQTTWHTVSVEELLRSLGVHPDHGLHSDEAQRRLDQHGPNATSPPPRESVVVKLLRSMLSGFQIVLATGGLLCFIVVGVEALYGVPDAPNIALGAMLLGCVVAWSVFLLYHEYRAEAVVAHVRAASVDYALVGRDGKLQSLPARSLVPGDIVYLSAGEKVPADCRMLSSEDMWVNSASITGENIDVALRSEPEGANVAPMSAKNIARSGCYVVKGRGRAVVFATGDRTVIGLIAASATVAVERQDTPLKNQFNRLIRNVTIFAVLIGLTFLILGLLDGYTPVQAITFAICIIVALVPEGLRAQHLAVMSVSVDRLRQAGCLVRSLEIAETLGAVTVICAELSGSITKNQFEVKHVCVDGVELAWPWDAPSMPFSRATAQNLRRLVTMARVNCDAVYVQDATAPTSSSSATALPTRTMVPMQQEGKGTISSTRAVRVKGDATDAGLLRMWDELARRNDDGGRLPADDPFAALPVVEEKFRRVFTIPFASEKKWMITVAEEKSMSSEADDLDGGSVSHVVCVKGAPERVLDMCSHAVVQGERRPLHECRVMLESMHDRMAVRGERVLAVAELALNAEAYPPGYRFSVEPPAAAIPNGDQAGAATDGVSAAAFGAPPSAAVADESSTSAASASASAVASVGVNFPLWGFTLLGFIGLEDALRPAAVTAVAQTKRAGIQLIAMSGDYASTALAVAQKAGIVDADGSMADDCGNAIPFNLGRRGTLGTEGSGSFIVDDPTPREPETVLAQMTRVVDGQDLEEFGHAEWRELLMCRNLIFARMQPQHKHRLVAQLQRFGHVVAITGSTVSDGPCLSAADVGIALGSGTAVARDAAHVTLHTDDYSAVIAAVCESRRIYYGLRSCLSYLLTSNIPEFAPFLLYVIFRIPLAIETIVILAVDLGTDLLPAVALAYEESEDFLMHIPPRQQGERLVGPHLLLFSYAVGVLHAFGGYFGFVYVFLDNGFSWSDIFGGNGIAFRNPWIQLSEAQKSIMRALCLSNTVYNGTTWVAVALNVSNISSYNYGNSSNYTMAATVTAMPPVATQLVAVRDCDGDGGWYEFRWRVLAEAQAAYFMAIVYAQLANILVRKTFVATAIFNLRRLFGNFLLVAALLAEVVIMLLVTQVPAVNAAFLMAAPTAAHGACTLWMFGFILIFDETRKAICRRVNADHALIHFFVR